MNHPAVLALRALKMGDLLVAVPALRGLRAGFPEHRIILACAPWLRPLVALTGTVDELLPTPRGIDAPLDIAPGVIDVAVNLHGNGAESRTRLEETEPRRRIGHAAAGWDGPDWVPGMHERDRWVRLLRAHGLPGHALDYRLDPPGNDPVPFGGGPGSAIIHVGAAYASRHWPIERFAPVAENLLDRGLRVLLTGDGKEAPRARRVAEAVRPAAGRRGENLRVVAGQLELSDFFAAIAGADVVVSADTGAAHLASAFGRPSVILFGPAAPELWGPPPGPHRVLTDASQRVGDAFADTPDPALLAVQVGDVLAALDDVLARS